MPVPAVAGIDDIGAIDVRGGVGAGVGARVVEAGVGARVGIGDVPASGVGPGVGLSVGLDVTAKETVGDGNLVVVKFDPVVVAVVSVPFVDEIVVVVVTVDPGGDSGGGEVVVVCEFTRSVVLT